MRDYDVTLAHGVLSGNATSLLELIGARRTLVTTTPTVHRLYGDGLARLLSQAGVQASFIVLPSGEGSKQISAVLDVCEAAQRHELGRRDVVLAFGGGVCSDIAGLAASLVRRGVPFIGVPTTLVGQVDAGIGLKCGVNHGGAKNYLGSYLPPKGVVVDPVFLRTLPERELRCGLSEMLKMALVADASLFELLRLHGPSLIATGFASPHGRGEHAILRSIDLMLTALAPNLFEDQTLERAVDFGHTFSPVLEELSGYELRHGEAVAIDMAVSVSVAEQLGLLDSATCDIVLSAIRRLGLPSWHPVVSEATLARGLAAAARHRDGRPNLVVPVGLGEVTFLRDLHEVPLPALGGALDRVREANVDAVVAPVGAPSV